MPHAAGTNTPKWKVMLAKMPPYLINEEGGLQEWSWPGVWEKFNHRHHSHFLPLYQFCEFDRDRDPEMWKANEVAFHLKHQSNRNDITHGEMNQGQCAARLGRSDIVYEVLSRMTASHQEVGPEFPNRLEQIKRDACEREGYSGWDDFARHVRVGAPSGDVELTRRITAHMNSLLSPAEK